ncbi:MAG TPA: DNA primase [Candidatus Moranbacteria bacterium]|nr:DNA primase [Candidatus Moranbacteria bacterium]
MNSDLEEIKSRLNIVDVLGEYIRLEKAGSNYRALCPFHNEKSPSFMVSEEKQIWHCFGCQKGGDIFGFVMEIEGLEFREALKMLAEKAGVKLAGFDPKKAEVKNRTLEILELATKWYEHQLWEGPGKVKILDYLHKRGLKDETIREFRLGYAPKGWRNILQFLEKRGYKIDEIKKTGLLVEKNSNSDKDINCYDRFRERIMFPIADYSGKVLGYSARVAPGGDETQAKYVNTPETEVYHKSRVLYGADKAKSEIKQKDFVLLVEGNMDVVAASQAGIKNVVAVSGTALTSEQIAIIKRYTPKVKMFFDMDSAGYEATKKSIKLCLNNDMNVEVVSIKDGKDAADIARENPEELKRAVETSKNAVQYILEDSLKRFDKNKVEDKRKISDLLVDILESISGSIEKSHWIKKIAQNLEISEVALTDSLKKANLKNRNNTTSNKIGEDVNPLPRKKIEIMLDEMIGLAFVQADIWKKVAEKGALEPFFKKDGLLNTMIERGKECHFSLEKFSAILKKEEKERAESLYFKKKFRLGLNNELEEVEILNPEREFQNIYQEIKKEIKKEKLEKIAGDLEVAESKGDKEAVKFLQMEFKNILEEISI